jgi:hypothetical protein
MVRNLFRSKRSRAVGEETILSTRQHELLTAELALLERLGAILEAYPATDEDRDALVDAAEQLTSLFLLVIVASSTAASPPSSTPWPAPPSCPRASPRPPPS